MQNFEADLNTELIALDNGSKALFKMGKTMLETYALYSFDLFCSGILNRSINLSKGFIDQIKSQNFLSAAPLVRLNLDSLLRVFAAIRLTNDLDTFAEQVLKGIEVRKMKDKNEKFMQDKHLVDLLAKENGFNWVEKIYKIGNQYIHFSREHILATIRPDESRERGIQGLISWGDSFIPESEKVWATRAMNQINLGIAEFTQKWINHKKALAAREESEKPDINIPN